jgi:hypothetical protein
MNHGRVHQISAEMCRRIDEQRQLLNGVAKLGAMSGEELDGYSRRNERIGQLAEESNELF